MWGTCWSRPGKRGENRWRGWSDPASSFFVADEPENKDGNKDDSPAYRICQYFQKRQEEAKKENDSDNEDDYKTCFL